MTEILNVWGDTETGSLIDLKSCGGYRYAEDPSTFVQLFSYALGDEPVKLWDPYSGEKMPVDLYEYLHNPKYIWTFHNAQFDRLILRHCLKLNIPIRRFRCSMAQALSHALPGSLEKCGEVLNIREDARKIKDGKRLMMLFCKPQKKKDGSIEWRTPKTRPEEWARYREYAINDTAAMREITKKLPKWNYPRGDELELWFLDQETNDAGINIDVEMVRSALTTIADEQKKLSAKTCEMTDGEVQAASQRDAMIRYVASQYGIELSDLRKSTVEKLIEDTETPPDLAELLRVRLSTCTTSTAKYKRLNNCTSLDGRMRGIIQYFGASRTGRDASRMAQFQNLPRPTVSHEEIMSGIDSVKNGTTDLLGYDVMPLLSSALRYVIHAPKGKKLAVADLAGIENRVLAYLAGEHWKLKAFRDFDNGIGDDMYKSAYAKAFKVKIADVTKDQRQIGKVLELSCFGPHTQVLTDSGYKNIVEVSLTDRLWDGVEWVSHQGLVNQGIRKILNMDGLEVTPDHLIKTKQTWTPAQQLVLSESMLSLALETGSENLPSSIPSGRRSGLAHKIWCWCSARAAQGRIRFLSTISEKVNQLGAEIAHKKSVVSGVKSTTDTLTSFRMTSIDGDCWGVYQPALTGAETPMIEILVTTGVEGSLCLKSGFQIGENFLHICRLLKDGTMNLSISIGSMLIKGMSQGILGSSLGKITATISEPLKSYNEECMSLRNVYDIALAGPRNRFTVKTNSGHLIVHNCGYQGGAGAIVTFATSFGIDLKELSERVLPTLPEAIKKESDNFHEWLLVQDEKANADPEIQGEINSTYGLEKDVYVAVDALKRLWRNGHPATVKFWRDAEDAVRNAVEVSNAKFHFGNGCFAIRKGKWVLIVLPSKHALCYPAMEIDSKGKLRFRGVHQFTKQWSWIHTFGGRLVENIVQSFSRDIFKYGQLNAVKQGYKVVLPVHDELVTEVPDTDEHSVRELEKIMSTNPPWAMDIPLAAEGFEDYRYHK